MFPGAVIAAVLMQVGPLVPPPLSSKDLDGFPPPQVAYYWSHAIKEHLLVADALVANSPQNPIYLERQRELRRRYRAWNALANSSVQASEFWTVIELMELQDLIGKEAYRRREMPFPFPLHLYEDVTGMSIPRLLMEEEAAPLFPLMEPLP